MFGQTIFSPRPLETVFDALVVVSRAAVAADIAVFNVSLDLLLVVALLWVARLAARVRFRSLISYFLGSPRP